MPTPGEGKDIARLREGLQLWLKFRFPEGFTDRGRRLTIGKQADSHSCGISVMNAMDFAMFKRPLFTHAQRHVLRVQYFIELIEYLTDMVGRPWFKPPSARVH